MGANPHVWLGAYFVVDPDKEALILELYNQGYDVYMAYARGTEYSRKHEKYSAKDGEFWDWSWWELGTQDTKAMVDYIYNSTGGQRVSYMGYSQGTTQIFAATAGMHEWFGARMNKVAVLAPCTVTAVNMYSFVNGLFSTVTDILDIHEIGGPSWLETLPKLSAVIGREQLAGFLAMGWGSRLTNVSLKAIYHYAQNAQEDVFQLYSDSYWWPLFAKKRTRELKLSDNTTIPFGMFIGANEDTCLIPQSEKN